MANPTVSLVKYVMPKGGADGVLVLDVTWATYAQNADVLDISGLKLAGLEAGYIKSLTGKSGTDNHDMTFVPAATPTLANAGTLRTFAAATQTVAGAYAKTFRCVGVLTK